ncbi:hypothetical protein K438DRAFT_1982980 [Mycena galopus ATCC 62051]|nr:hypothetical protein K438DRAFT_1982980 [Mycena galopus ATCC 62051]
MHLVPPRAWSSIAPLLLLVLLLIAAQSVHAVPTRPEFYDPRILGGQMLNNASKHGGEPLNVIISGYSTPSVLTDTGFYGFAASLGFAHECLGLHMGARQPANLGDGNGWVDEITVLRESYGSASLGTCWETVIGGNHLRMYRQATSGALFLAVSQEESLFWHHTISRDGYNIGRDLLVQRTAHARGTSYKGVRYFTTARTLEGLMSPGKLGCRKPQCVPSHLFPYCLSSSHTFASLSFPCSRGPRALPPLSSFPRPSPLLPSPPLLNRLSTHHRRSLTPPADITTDGRVVLLTVTASGLPPSSRFSFSFTAIQGGFRGAVQDFFSLLFWVHTTWCMQNMWTVW